MTRDEHIRLIAAEECMEVAQRLSKALRFGMSECQQGQPLNNRERVIEEYTDLVAAMELAGFPLQVINGRKVDAKLEKIEHYLIYSAECGTVTPDLPPDRLTDSEIGRRLNIVNYCSEAHRLAADVQDSEAAARARHPEIELSPASRVTDRWCGGGRMA